MSKCDACKVSTCQYGIESAGGIVFLCQNCVPTECCMCYRYLKDHSHGYLVRQKRGIHLRCAMRFTEKNLDLSSSYTKKVAEIKQTQSRGEALTDIESDILSQHPYAGWNPKK